MVGLIFVMVYFKQKREQLAYKLSIKSKVFTVQFFLESQNFLFKKLGDIFVIVFIEFIMKSFDMHY